MPFFSIVIPTYNAADRLRDTLHSVIAQTFDDFEALVMDDGSTDRTGDMVRALGDSRITYAWEHNSGGPATPRNRGIDAARADWICFLDADDWWAPTKLARVHDTIVSHPSIDAVCNDEELVVAGSPVRRLVYGPFVDDFYRAMLIEGNCCSTSAMTVRRSFLDEHRLRFNTAPDYVIVEDYDLWLRMARAGCQFEFLHEVLGEYRVATGNISLDTDKAFRNEEVLLRDHVFGLQTFDSNRQRLWRRVVMRPRVARARSLASRGQTRAAIGLAVRTMMASPSADAGYLLLMAKRAVRGLAE